MNNKKTNEAVVGSDIPSSFVGKSAFAEENVHATGHYVVEAYGPKAEFFDEYALVVQAAQQLIEQGNSLAARQKMEEAKWMTEPKWTDTINNVVTTAGKNLALDSFLAGSSYTAAFYVGLIGSTGYSGAPVAGDTMASHANWQESTAYSQGARPTASWAAASSGSKSLASPASYTMNTGVTIKGCFLTTDSTKGGTSGTLYSAGLFSGGDKILSNLDTLNVSYTTSM